MSMIEIKSVKQTFKVGFWMKEVQILKGVSFSVEKNTVYGLLGPNGAGKTTLIHLITGLRKPSEGQILIEGLDAFSIKARSMTGYLPERPYFHDHLTGKALLKYMGALSGMLALEIDKRIPVVLRQVRMEHAGDLELRKYSKGMLQRIGLAQAILHNPKILVLDEPMSGLDPLGRKEIRELILQLAQDGKTIFFSSHVIPDVEAICQKVALIENGELTSSGTIQDFLESERTPAEVAFSGLDEKFLHAKGIKISQRGKISGGFRVIIESANDINPVVQEIVEKKGKILWATPIRRSLESLFEVGRK